MGKDTGFLEYRRKDNTDIPPQERIRNFEEFHRPLDEKKRREQAARCMSCGVPFCQSTMQFGGMVTGCPLHNLVPEWNDQVYQGQTLHAYERLEKTNNFPEFTGRVCPALCEKSCMCGQWGDAVTIHDNELFIIETAFEKGYVTPKIPKVRSGKKVAVVGSGPSGLAVADTLNHRGHQVTVFERDDRIGGLLMYGIPNMKLDKAVIERRRMLMEAEGVTIRTGIDIKSRLEAKKLLENYDAVVLCCGAKEPRPLPAADPGKIKGVYYAVDFLKSTTASLLDAKGKTTADLEKQGGYISAKGKHVVIVGGGDTGNDCIGTVLRHGCRSVTALEMMAEPPLSRRADNPWPEWPKVKKTDYGHEEAVSVFGKDPRLFERTVKEAITDENGVLTHVKIVKVAFENGKLQEVEGSEKVIPCELLLIAAGFIGAQPYTAEAFGLSRSARGTVITEENTYRTTVPGVFSAGDMRRGQSLVVWAIEEGRECAREVDRYLMGYSTL